MATSQLRQPRAVAHRLPPAGPRTPSSGADQAVLTLPPGRLGLIGVEPRFRWSRLGSARAAAAVAAAARPLRYGARSGSPPRHRRVAVCGDGLSGTLLLLASVRETSVIKISRSAKNVKVTFVLLADEPAAICSVVGDFNGWQPGIHQLRRRSNGTRSASVTLPRGTRTRFRYLGKNGHWFNDPDLAEFDGPDSVLAV